MIISIQNYIETLIENVQFGQIQNESDSLINVNITDTGQNLYFRDDKTHNLLVNVFIRELYFEDTIKANEKINLTFNKIYDVTIDNIHIVDTKQSDYGIAERDIDNRYYTNLSFQMIVERIGE